MPEPTLRIALLEDDPDQCAAIAGWLQRADYDVTAFRRSQDLIAAIRRRPFDMLILDKRVPDLSGIEVLKWVRTDLSLPSPVFVITSHDSEDDVVEALACGADDYLVKPLRRAELIARIEAAWRRHAGKANAAGSIEVGNYRLDRGRSQAWLLGQPVELTQKEFDIAWHLFRHLGSMIARDDILRAVWGLNDSVQTRTLDVHMSRVRRKLALRPENGVRLQSIYSFGYRFDLAAE